MAIIRLKATDLFKARAVVLGAAVLPFIAAADMRDDFRSPQGAVRENTGPLFWMHGTETEARLREYVGRVDESGQGILTIESRPHVDWMREGWWRDVDIVLDECKKRGVKMMVFDDYWWPSQGMGGKYPIPEEYQCRDIKADVYANGEAPETAANEICRVVASETGTGVFRLGPDGDKTIVYSWFVPPNGKVEGLGSRQGSFPYVNGLDEEAVDWFLATYYQPYYDRYRSAFEDGTIPGFFFDEPETMGVWGAALERELAARGEDVGELLTAFKFKLADPEAQARAFYRYHDARVEVWGRTMYGRHSAWCEAHGVFSSGHFMEHSDSFYSLAMCGGNVMQLMKHVTVPGVDLVGRQYLPSQRENKGRQAAYGQMPKYASSAAHVYNRRNGLNWCEIFGAYGQDITYPQMKWLCDWHQSQGCYYMIPHSFNPKAPYDTDCPPYFYNGGYEPRYPLFRVWADYNNRCAMLLSEGEHVCTIAQCVPGMSFHVGETIRPEMFAFAIQDAQLDSDWLGYDAVESAIIENNPRTGRPSLRTANGKEHYDILTLPATEYVPFATLEKALAFAAAGGVVVGYGIRPRNTPTRGKSAEDVIQLVADIFAQPAAFFIEGEPNGAQLRAAFARPYPGTDQPLAVRELDFVGLSSEDGRMLALNHYEKNGDAVYFIANQDAARRRDLTVRANGAAEQAELWDPMQGTVERPAIENGLIKLALEPSEAVFLVWPKNPCASLPVRMERPAGGMIALAATESVTPVVINAEDEDPVLFSLEGAKWIWHPVNPRAEGEVTFRASIDVPAAVEAQLIFACDNAAEVFVNGQKVAEQKDGGAPDYPGWRTPVRAAVALNSGSNEVTVKASNPIPGYAGFVAAFTWPGGAFKTDAANWEVSRDDGAFVKAGEICAYGGSPWGRFADAGDRDYVLLSLEGAKWIWHPVDPRAEGEVTFRASIDVPAAVEAQLIFACDNAAEVFVNGQKVAEQKDGGAPDYPGWRTPTRAKVALNSGANAISVKATNPIPGHAGFVAAFTWPGGALRTGAGDWEVSRDGGAFVKAGEVCTYGGSPWGRLGEKQKITFSPFSESVATDCTFKLPAVKQGDRVYLVCDEVAGEKSAAVTVNGAYAGGFIGAPYRLDITKSVKKGENTLQMKPFRVTNPKIVMIANPTVVVVR